MNETLTYPDPRRSLRAQKAYLSLLSLVMVALPACGGKIAPLSGSEDTLSCPALICLCFARFGTNFGTRPSIRSPTSSSPSRTKTARIKYTPGMSSPLRTPRVSSDHQVTPASNIALARPSGKRGELSPRHPEICSTVLGRLLRASHLEMRVSLLDPSGNARDPKRKRFGFVVSRPLRALPTMTLFFACSNERGSGSHSGPPTLDWRLSMIEQGTNRLPRP